MLNQTEKKMTLSPKDEFKEEPWVDVICDSPNVYEEDDNGEDEGE